MDLTNQSLKVAAYDAVQTNLNFMKSNQDNWPPQTDRQQTDREPTDRWTNSPPDQLTAEGANSAYRAKKNRRFSC